jgi:hypothetical protein
LNPNYFERARMAPLTSPLKMFKSPFKSQFKSQFKSPTKTSAFSSTEGVLEVIRQHGRCYTDGEVRSANRCDYTQRKLMCTRALVRCRC